MTSSRQRRLPQRPQRPRHVRRRRRSPRRPTTATGSPAWPSPRRSCRCACSTPRAKAKPRRSPKACCYAVKHGAQVINLSLEFSPGVTASDIPELIEALRYAHRRGVLVVAAAGNEGHAAIAYPAQRALRGLGRREHRTRLPRRLLKRRHRPDARGPRRRRRRRPPRRPQLPSRTAARTRRLPGHLHGQLAPTLRPACGL